MRKLLIPLASSFLLVAPAFADFGSADTGQSGGNEVSSFKAKCGEERKACNLEIDFQNERIIVDGNSYVEKYRIKEARYMIKERSCLTGGKFCSVPLVPPRHTTDITYKKSDGSISTARIMFRNLNVGRRFFDSVALFLGVQPEDVNKDGLSGLVLNIDIAKKVRKTVKDSGRSFPLVPIGVGLGGGLVIGLSTFFFIKRKKEEG